MSDISSQSYQEKIGKFIRDLREEKKWTQEDFANELGTSQSAVARMEKGEQNFTTDMLGKISKVFNRKIVSLSTGSIDFKINGGRQLKGEVTTNTSKNGAMGLMCAALLNKSKTILHGIPRIEEVNRIIEVLESIGVSIKWVDRRSLEIVPPKEFDMEGINRASAIKTRSIIMFIGPLIHRLKNFSLPHSQGCKLGSRTIAAHKYGLEDLGVEIQVTEDSYKISTKALKAREVIMYESGDTAVENMMMAAAKIPGKTVIKFAAPNYQVQDVGHFLQKLGVKVEGLETTTITIHGVDEINEVVEYWNSEDPIEAMMFISAAITTHSKLMIRRCPIDFLELELYKLKKMGLKFTQSDTYLGRNGAVRLTDIEIFPSTLMSLDEKVYGRPFPGINIDNLPFFVPIATQTHGTTLIHDWVYENRAIYFMELAKLGANMILADPHRIYVKGPTRFKPTQLVCPPALRPAMIILIAMLAAPGTSVLRNVYSISRGYEEIAERLNEIGADIEIMSGF